jgi:hypothetical protein
MDLRRERRALLDALALDATGWRTRRAFSTEEDLATITGNRHLEGVVAKRHDASWATKLRPTARIFAMGDAGLELAPGPLVGSDCAR